MNTIPNVKQAESYGSDRRSSESLKPLRKAKNRAVETLDLPQQASNSIKQA